LPSAEHQSQLAQAYLSLRTPLWRRRCGQELRLIDEHLRTEALSVRDGQTGKLTALGVRFVFRLRPVADLAPAPTRRDDAFDDPTPFPPRWIDPVNEGNQEEQRTAQVFLDADELPAVIEGLRQMPNGLDKLPVYGPEADCAFALSDALVFGLVGRAGRQSGYVESRTLGCCFPLPPSKYWELLHWLETAVEGLKDLQKRETEAQGPSPANH